MGSIPEDYWALDTQGLRVLIMYLLGSCTYEPVSKEDNSA